MLGVRFAWRSCAEYGDAATASLAYCHGAVARLPEGTITFLLTDLQESTRAWEIHPKAMRSAMARHDEILTSTVRGHSGALVEAGREGDSVLAVFTTAASGAECALDIQKNFARASWPEGLELKVRIAMHTGEAQLATATTLVRF
jgi:class 3 adenylate cyclase